MLVPGLRPIVNVDRRRRLSESCRAPWVVVTGLDGAGKSTLVRRLAAVEGAYQFRLPYHAFVKPALQRSGHAEPFGDVWTDRLLFAADARLTNYLIREWRQTYQFLISQRGWMDGYVFGAAQGIPYEATAALLGIGDLERPSAIIHLTADPDVAFDRIRRDSHADKFETPLFIRRQHRETVRFFEAVRAGDPALAPFFGIPATLIDTTDRTPDAVFGLARDFLSTLSALEAAPAASQRAPASKGGLTSGVARGRALLAGTPLPACSDRALEPHSTREVLA